MRGRRRSGVDQSGETLAEILITISIMGILFVAVLGAIGVSVQTSGISRSEGTAEALLRTSAEQIQQAPYANCATSYPVAAGTGGVTVSITSIKYWDGTSTNPATFGGCPSGGDQGVQSIDLKAQASDGRATETLTTYKREP